MLVLINRSIGSVVIFRNSLNSFRSGQGIRTTSLGPKLLQKLKKTREEVLYKLFIYPIKT